MERKIRQGKIILCLERIKAQELHIEDPEGLSPGSRNFETVQLPSTLELLTWLNIYFHDLDKNELGSFPIHSNEKTNLDLETKLEGITIYATAIDFIIKLIDQLEFYIERYLKGNNLTEEDLRELEVINQLHAIIDLTYNLTRISWKMLHTKK